MHITSLPIAMKQLAFQYLTATELAEASKVSQQFQSISKQESLWQAHCQRIFPTAYALHRNTLSIGIGNRTFFASQYAFKDYAEGLERYAIGNMGSFAALQNRYAVYHERYLGGHRPHNRQHIRVWNMQTGTHRRLILPNSPESVGGEDDQAVYEIAKLNERAIIASYVYPKLVIWNVETNSRSEIELSGVGAPGDPPARSLVVLNQRFVIAAFGFGRYRVWDAQAGGAPIRNFVLDKDISPMVSGLDGSSVLCGSDDNRLVVRDMLLSGRIQRVFLERHNAAISHIAVRSPHCAVSATLSQVFVWDTVQGVALRNLDNLNYISAIAFSPRALLICTYTFNHRGLAQGGSVKLWEDDGGLTTLRGPAEKVDKVVSLNADFTLWLDASIGHKPWRIWDIGQSREIVPEKVRCAPWTKGT